MVAQCRVGGEVERDRVGVERQRVVAVHGPPGAVGVGAPRLGRSGVRGGEHEFEPVVGHPDREQVRQPLVRTLGHAVDQAS